MMRFLIAILALVVAAPALAHDKHDQVVAFDGGEMELSVEGNPPGEGSVVEVYIQLPDLEDTAWVCSGKVSRVVDGRVFAVVTERSADPRKGDLATIKSAH